MYDVNYMAHAYLTIIPIIFSVNKNKVVCDWSLIYKSISILD